MNKRHSTCWKSPPPHRPRPGLYSHALGQSMPRGMPGSNRRCFAYNQGRWRNWMTAPPLHSPKGKARGGDRSGRLLDAALERVRRRRRLRCHARRRYRHKPKTDPLCAGFITYLRME